MRIFGWTIIGVISVGSIFLLWMLSQTKDAPMAMRTNNAKVTDYTNSSSSIERLLQNPDVQTSIEIDDIFGGGVGKDGIPSIQNPKIESVQDAPTWLRRDGDGIMLERNGRQRFYPYQVLVSHEIVNDIFEDEYVLVTYCPLCFTGVVYNRVIEGAPTEFGVSGKLWESNLLMYNRSNPESLWSQALGEAVVGEATGTKLQVVRFDITTYGAFADAFPEGDVVTGDADARFPRPYTRIPYGGDLRDIDPIFPFSGEDARLEKTDIVLGLIVEGEPKAYVVSALEKQREVTDQLGGWDINITYNEQTGIAEFYHDDGNAKERLTAIPSFWISWVSMHPDTEVFK